MDDPSGVSFTSSEVVPFFPTLVYKWQLAPSTFEPLNAKILAKLDELTADEPPLAPGGMWQTDHRFHEAEGMGFFKNMLQGSVTSVLQSLKIKHPAFEVTGCWANISGPAAPHKMHTHPNNYLSGVYYVKTQDKANSIYFYDPRHQVGVISPETTERGPATAGKVSLQVDPGTMIIFPSWLQHSVNPNRSPENRVSIAFNIMFSNFAETMSPPQWEGNISAEEQ